MPPPSPPSKRPSVSSPGGRDRGGAEAPTSTRSWLQSAMVMGLLFCLLLSLSSITVTRRPALAKTFDRRETSRKVRRGDASAAGGNATLAARRREKFVAGDLLRDERAGLLSRLVHRLRRAWMASAKRRHAAQQTRREARRRARRWLPDDWSWRKVRLSSRNRRASDALSHAAGI